jgi:ABC-2 type transport system ATP-binding protein
VLLFDEPVNGLDPEGILWVRNLLQSLAAEGRTVLVSSHLLSEMAVTAEHLVVIGRGRLIADTSVGEFVGKGCRGAVRVRTPCADTLLPLLAEAGGKVSRTPDGALVVGGMAAATIGDLAASQGIALHELAPELGSLEQAFMELTRDAVEFHGEGDVHHHRDDDPLALGARR